MTHLLKPEDKREYGMNSDKSEGGPVFLACWAWFFVIACGLSCVGIIIYLSRVVGLKGW